MNDVREKYPSLFNLDEEDTNLFEQELKQYILDLSGEFIYEFKNIHFRESSSNFYCGVFDSIKENENVYFEGCYFYFKDITHKGNNIFKGFKVTFKKCTFVSSFNISPDFNYPNVELIYENCTFLDILTIEHFDSYITFNDCSFDDIVLKNCKVKKAIFSNKEDVKCKINKFDIDNCIFEKRFILNNCGVEIFNCTNSVFKDKFEFKNNKSIKKFNIYNSNFKEISDMFGSEFIKFKISKSIFDDFVGFENCIFGSSNQLANEVAEFEYVTFKDILTLRKTKFLSGLDIENINLQNDANFLKAKVELKNTPRETLG